MKVSELLSLYTNNSALEQAEEMGRRLTNSPVLKNYEEMGRSLINSPAMRQVAELNSVFAKMNSVFAKINLAMQTIDRDKLNQFILTAEKYLQENSELSDIAIGEDGTISIGSDSIEPESLNKKLTDISDKILSEADGTNNLSLQTFIQYFKSIEAPIIRKILFQMFLSVILAVASNVISYPLNNYIYGGGFEKRIVIKQISREIFNTSRNKEIATYRLVTADILHVRQAKKKKSSVVGYLRFGDVVKILKKGRHWSLVVLKDEENEIILQGWVFSRYLKKIK